MVNFYSPGGHLTWRRYSIYCVLLVLGLTFEYLGRDSSRDYPLRSDLLQEHRVSLQQTIIGIGTLVVYLIATKTVVSRALFFSTYRIQAHEYAENVERLRAARVLERHAR